MMKTTDQANALGVIPKQHGFTRRVTVGTFRHVVRALLYGVVGAAIVLIAGAVMVLERRPDLDVWHKAHLDEEFTKDSEVASLEAYLALEDRLFAQLDKEVYGGKPPTEEVFINRYRRGSISDPKRWPTDWNRSFVLESADPPVGVLMLHGLSDSPYSMRTLAAEVHAAGATVLALRLPGHGTAPSGLVHAEWDDWAAAAVLAMRHLRKAMGERPVYIVGYSNGGAIAVHYALEALADSSLPMPAGVVLMSPEIGITRLAGLAKWQSRLGKVLGLRKLAWNSIGTEHDPFKYQSFALNAGREAFEFTGEIQGQITELISTGALERLPKLLAFQSVLDATVLPEALVRDLFQRLPAGGHELVVFDVDRTDGMEQLYRRDPRPAIEQMFANADRQYAITLLSNRDPKTKAVVARHVGTQQTEATVTELGLEWPPGLFSLSHVALPFPPDDPLYGGIDPDPSPGIHIGDLDLRGERGVLHMSSDYILRLRWNPFHSYLVERVLAFMGLEDSAERLRSPKDH